MSYMNDVSFERDTAGNLHVSLMDMDGDICTVKVVFPSAVKVEQTAEDGFILKQPGLVPYLMAGVSAIYFEEGLKVPQHKEVSLSHGHFTVATISDDEATVVTIRLSAKSDNEAAMKRNSLFENLFGAVLRLDQGLRGLASESQGQTILVSSISATDDSWRDDLFTEDSPTATFGADSVEPISYRCIEGRKTRWAIRGKGEVSHEDGVWKLKPQGDSIKLLTDEQSQAYASRLSLAGYSGA